LSWSHIQISQTIDGWKQKNISQIQEAIFLENTLALNTRLVQLGAPKNTYLSTEISLRTVKGETISTEDFKIDFQKSTLLNFLSGKVYIQLDLFFADRRVVTLYITGNIHLFFLLIGTVGSLVIGFIVFLILERSVYKPFSQIEQTIVLPILQMAGSVQNTH